MTGRLSFVAWVWLFLLAATLVNWTLMEMGVLGLHVSAKLLGSAILLLAFFKVRLVIRHFMEVAEAPVMLGRIFDGWIVMTCASLLFQFLI